MSYTLLETVKIPKEIQSAASITPADAFGKDAPASSGKLSPRRLSWRGCDSVNSIVPSGIRSIIPGYLYPPKGFTCGEVSVPETGLAELDRRYNDLKGWEQS